MNYTVWDGTNAKPTVGRPTPVGVYPLGLSPEGIADMAGNVWEWCVDGKRAYSTDEQRNPVGPTKAEVGRVVRGGSWDSYPWYCRVSFRLGDHPSFRGQNTGFRVVCGLFGQDSK